MELYFRISDLNIIGYTNVDFVGDVHEEVYEWQCIPIRWNDCFLVK